MDDRDAPTLSTDERATLLATFADFADSIDKVTVFGSRALGRARASSDIDLAIHGPIDDRVIARIWTLLDESDLAVTVDLVRYRGLGGVPIRRHIDQCAKLLFSQADLLAARDAASRAA